MGMPSKHACAMDVCPRLSLLTASKLVGSNFEARKLESSMCSCLQPGPGRIVDSVLPPSNTKSKGKYEKEMAAAWYSL